MGCPSGQDDGQLPRDLVRLPQLGERDAAAADVPDRGAGERGEGHFYLFLIMFIISIFAFFSGERLQQGRARQAGGGAAHHGGEGARPRRRHQVGQRGDQVGLHNG